MDEFIDKIKDGASKTKDAAGRIAKQVAKHTSNAITSTKLTYAINEANNKIKDIYSQIGKTMYEEYLDGATVNEQFADMFEKIDALMHDIEALQAKKAELKKSRHVKFLICRSHCYTGITAVGSCYRNSNRCGKSH